MSNVYQCNSANRRENVRKNGAPRVNGIDFLEVGGSQTTLVVTFIHNLPDAPNNPVPNDNSKPLASTNITITGGVRIKSVRVLSVVRSADNVLTITVDTTGDFSLYTLSLVNGGTDAAPPYGFDPRLADVRFSFKIACLKDFDCKTADACPPEYLASPKINYLAKDYASFRQLMLDRLALLAPQWTESSAADIGMALVEILAYIGDSLSYWQDAVATEAYLGTARRRTSIRRHARLVDYFMHDGCNARAWVQIQTAEDLIPAGASGPTIPAGTKLLTRIRGQAAWIKPDPDVYLQALNAGVQVYETMYDQQALFAAHNSIPLYTWGETECCLATGATHATLDASHKLNLVVGDVVILAEVLNPSTGGVPDADPTHRHPVRLIRVTDGVDPLTNAPITEIEWHPDDALAFPLCISSKTDALHGGAEVNGVTVALGNVVLADHGRWLNDPTNIATNLSEPLGSVPRSTLTRTLTAPSSADPSAAQATPTVEAELASGGIATESIPPRYGPALKQSPLTQAAPAPFLTNPNATIQSAASAMQWSMDDVKPVLNVQSILAPIGLQAWHVERDLLTPDDSDGKKYVVEIETDGTATLRFGDGLSGTRPPPDTAFSAQYRIGNGTDGNVAAGAIAHLLLNLSTVTAVTNPLPAQGGIDPEEIEQVRQRAPFAFRVQERAVTTDDYSQICSRRTDILRSQATIRWTRSWNTIFVTPERNCGCDVTPQFKQDLLQFLDTYRMAGQDLDIDTPRYVPLEIDMRVCVKAGYFRSQVKAALSDIFSDRILPNGVRGAFYPDNFTFGQPVYLSRLYAAAQAVDGVEEVRILTAQRQGNPETDATATGVLTMDRLEIAQLNNDPNFPDRGVFKLDVEGGQ